MISKTGMLKCALRAFLPLLVVMNLSGCATRHEDSAISILTSSSYNVAESLMQQARPSVTRETPIQIGPLADINNPSAQAPLGKMISQQISARLVQLGYTVIGTMLDGAPTPQQLQPAAAAEEEIVMAEPLPPGEVDNYAGAWRGGGSAGRSRAPRTASAAPMVPQTGSAMIVGQYAEASDQVFVNLRIMDLQTGRLLAASDYTLPRTRDIRELMRGKKSGIFGL